MPKKTRNTWSDSSSWTMVKFVHQEVMRGTKAIVGVAWYVALSCDEMFTIENQFWLFVHYYVVHNCVRIPIFILLDKVLEGSSNDNLTQGHYGNVDNWWRVSNKSDYLGVHLLWGKWCYKIDS
jgi:hypothetical protein